MSQRRLTDEEWKRIGADYINGTSINQISKMHGVTRVAIDKAIKRYGWERATPVEVKKSLEAEIETRARTIGPDERQQIISDAAPGRVDVIEKHQKAWAKIYELRDDAFALLQGRSTKILTNITATEGGATLHDREHKDLKLKDRIMFASRLIAIFEADVRALTLAQEGERRAHGFDYKGQQGDSRIDDDVARRRRELISALIEGGVIKSKSPPQIEAKAVDITEERESA